MGRADYLALGDYNTVCYQCGFKRKASTLVKNWEGYYVCPEHNEPRQTQDFVRAIPDNQTIPWSQPAPSVVYTYTLEPIGFGDGGTTFFQLGSGLYSLVVVTALVNGVPAAHSQNLKGGITFFVPPAKGTRITASGTETVPS